MKERKTSCWKRTSQSKISRLGLTILELLHVIHVYENKGSTSIMKSAIIAWRRTLPPDCYSIFKISVKVRKSGVLGSTEMCDLEQLLPNFKWSCMILISSKECRVQNGHTQFFAQNTCKTWVRPGFETQTSRTREYLITYLFLLSRLISFVNFPLLLKMQNKNPASILYEY